MSDLPKRLRADRCIKDTLVLYMFAQSFDTLTVSLSVLVLC